MTTLGSPDLVEHIGFDGVGEPSGVSGQNDDSRTALSLVLHSIPLEECNFSGRGCHGYLKVSRRLGDRQPAGPKTTERRDAPKALGS